LSHGNFLSTAGRLSNGKTFIRNVEIYLMIIEYAKDVLKVETLGIMDLVDWNNSLQNSSHILGVFHRNVYPSGLHFI
jgi:hypothetical protein